MTEERIITTIEKLRNAVNNASDFKAFLLIVKSFSEPAPPKDWRPVCFYNWSDKLGLCEMSDLKEFVKDHLANCSQCPYRKME